jgi:predicted transcriptional regulator
MLKEIFSSNARVKLLKIFLLNPDEEFFIRELTRKLDEQINSIRRELDNLKKVGLLKSKMRNRKKYYYVNKDFIIFSELRDIFIKGSGNDQQMARKISKMGDVDFLLLSGVFIGKQSSTDLLLVGEVDKRKLQEYLDDNVNQDKDVKFTIISKKDFLYRLECKDKFIHDLFQDEKNIVLVNKLKKELEKFEELS